MFCPFLCRMFKMILFKLFLCVSGIKLLNSRATRYILSIYLHNFLIYVGNILHRWKQKYSLKSLFHTWTIIPTLSGFYHRAEQSVLIDINQKFTSNQGWGRRRRRVISSQWHNMLSSKWIDETIWELLFMLFCCGNSQIQGTARHEITVHFLHPHPT